MASLPTPELLHALKLAGWSVSQEQLTDWRRRGLLPEPIRKGLGRGKGIVQLWEAACVDNVRVILGTVRKQHPNLTEAGRLLFSQGASIGAALIRHCLREIPRDLEMKKDRAEEAFASFPKLKVLADFLTAYRIKTAIDDAEDDTLTRLYERIGKLEEPLDLAVSRIMFFTSVADLLKCESAAPSDLRDKVHADDYVRRRTALAWAVLLVSSCGEELRLKTQDALNEQITQDLSERPATPWAVP